MVLFLFSTYCMLIMRGSLKLMPRLTPQWVLIRIHTIIRGVKLVWEVCDTLHLNCQMIVHVKLLSRQKQDREREEEFILLIRHGDYKFSICCAFEVKEQFVFWKEAPQKEVADCVILCSFRLVE